jgi:cyclase
MQQLSANVFVETGLRGANHGFVTTSDGIVLIDTPHKPSDALRLKAEIERRGRLRYIINTEPHGDHWTGNSFFSVPVVAHEGVRARMLGADLNAHVARVSSFGPEGPSLLQNYRPNAPVITFQTELTLHVGNHAFHLVHMPGHTPYQAAVLVKEEGIVFTSDNILPGADLDPGGSAGPLVAHARGAARFARGNFRTRPRTGLRQALSRRTGKLYPRVDGVRSRRRGARLE